MYGRASMRTSAFCAGDNLAGIGEWRGWTEAKALILAANKWYFTELRDEDEGGRRRGGPHLPAPKTQAWSLRGPAVRTPPLLPRRSNPANRAGGRVAHPPLALPPSWR